MAKKVNKRPAANKRPHPSPPKISQILEQCSLFFVLLMDRLIKKDTYLKCVAKMVETEYT